MKHTSLISMAVLGAVMSSTPVQAASVGISGQFVFQNTNGNCGIGLDTKYPCTDPLCPGGDTNADNICDADGVPIDAAVRSFNKRNQGFQDIRVSIHRATVHPTTGAVTVLEEVGFGFTEADGTFGIVADDHTSSTALTLVARLEFRHETNRFQLGNGTRQMWWSQLNGAGGQEATFTVTNGNTVGAGQWNWGANGVANQYEAARAVWDNAFAQSTRLVNDFGMRAGVCPAGDTACSTTGGLALIHIDTTGTIGAGCNTNFGSDAWASGSTNTVCLGNAALNQQGNISRAQHELAHIADWVSHAGNTHFSGMPYTFGGSPAVHGLRTQEWAEPVFTEAVATHWAHVANYWPGANTPFTCIATGRCDTAGGNANLETLPAAAGDGTGCGAGGNRMELNAMRYFWDTYDTTNDVDAAGTTVDDLNRVSWHIADATNAFAVGVANNQRDETHQSGMTFVSGLCGGTAPDSNTDGVNDNCDPDGHSVRDFAAVWQARGANGENTDSSGELAANCMNTVGD